MTTTLGTARLWLAMVDRCFTRELSGRAVLLAAHNLNKLILQL
jgi:hypothetical protein